MTQQPYVGIYWTRPVPRAGFVSLSADVDVAAGQSMTIRYQRDLARRHVRLAHGTMVHEIALLELAPDRAGLPLSGGPVSVLVHYGSWRYNWGGRRSGSGWRSRPLDGLGSWRAIPQ